MRGVFAFISIFILISGLVGCGEDEEVSEPQADRLISEGWKEYVAGNYDDAILKFQQALEDEPDNAEAYNGIGWTKAKQGRINDSIESFKVAVTREPANADAHAGLAGAYLADGDYERAVASAKLVLSIDTEYSSVHDNINSAGIHVLLAECYYNMGNYSEARSEIDLLGDYGKSLDPDNPSYLADLLKIIEKLSEKIY